MISKGYSDGSGLITRSNFDRRSLFAIMAVGVLLAVSMFSVIGNDTDAYVETSGVHTGVEEVYIENPLTLPDYGYVDPDEIEEALAGTSFSLHDGFYTNTQTQIVFDVTTFEQTDPFSMYFMVDGSWQRVAEFRIDQDTEGYHLLGRLVDAGLTYAEDDYMSMSLNYRFDSIGNPVGSNISLEPEWGVVNRNLDNVMNDVAELRIWCSSDYYVFCENVRVDLPAGSNVDVSYNYSTALGNIDWYDSEEGSAQWFYAEVTDESDSPIVGQTRELAVADIFQTPPEGYALAGYATAPNGPKVYDPDDTINVPVGTRYMLFAVYEEANTLVTFMSNGETYHTVSMMSGSTLTPPTQPEEDGFTFTGWYTDPECTIKFDFSTPIYSNLTLYAGWEGDLHFTSKPQASMNVTRVLGVENTMRFDASDSVDFMTVHWDFGDGTTSDEVYVEHYYERPGTYEVTLTVYNDVGDNAITQSVTVGDGSSGDDGPVAGDDEFPWLLVIAVVLIVMIAIAIVVTKVL